MATQSETSKELKSLKKDLSELRKDVSSLLSAAKSEGKDKVTAAGSRVGETVREHAAEISHRLEERGQQARECVEEHPFKTALAALGAGVLVGALLGRNHQ
jgi:ElaB/YqjD/DUF883 family membrane-anchored ribosome-binding protein